MRLSKRVNYILLPIICLLLTLSALFTYQAIKTIVVDNVTAKLTNEAKRLDSEIVQQAHESIGLIRLFVSSREAIAYLNDPESYYSTYSHQGQLFNNFNVAVETSPFLRAITIFSLAGESLFHLDVNDPFSDPAISNVTQRYIDQLLEAKNMRLMLSNTNPIYRVVMDEQGDTKLSVVMPYSAAHVLTDLKYADAQSLFVIQLENNATLFEAEASSIKSEYGDGVNVTFETAVVASTSDKERASTVDAVVSSGISIRISGVYGAVVLEMSPDHLSDLLLPLKLATVLVTFLLIVTLYVALRAMIHVQILLPIERLVKQIKGSHEAGLGSDLKVLTSEDEVADLNNSYLELLSHVSHLANFDTLTGLLNRNSFSNALTRSVKDAIHKNTKAALLYIDLDNFKLVNDTFGHSEGDALLIEFGKKLRETLRPFDELHTMSSERGVARLAGDEFAILLTDLPNAEAADAAASRIMALFETGFAVNDNVHDVQACIGITIAPDDGTEVEMLVRNADAAMYSAKQNGKNNYCFYAQDLEDKMQVRHIIAAGLKSAVDNNRFHLVFMPIYRCDDLSIAGVEVLIRTTEPLLQGYGPDQFISIAEESGLIRKIDLWVIEQAFIAQKKLTDLCGFDGFFAINISARELHNDNFVADLTALFDTYPIEPADVELEITETYLETKDSRLLDNLHSLKALGVRLALDDFGTGYTGFSQLASYPVDIIKIDRSFTQEINVDVSNRRLTVDIIVELARLYELTIVAEGVEDLQQLEYIQDLGVECVQGFYLSRPLTYEDFSKLVTQKNAEDNYQ